MISGEKKSENCSQTFQTVCAQWIPLGRLGRFRWLLRILSTLEMTIDDGRKCGRAGIGAMPDYDFSYDFFKNRKPLAGRGLAPVSARISALLLRFPEGVEWQLNDFLNDFLRNRLVRVYRGVVAVLRGVRLRFTRFSGGEEVRYRPRLFPRFLVDLRINYEFEHTRRDARFFARFFHFPYPAHRVGLSPGFWLVFGVVCTVFRRGST